MRWRDEVDKDAEVSGVRNRWMIARDRNEWIGFLEGTKAQ